MKEIITNDLNKIYESMSKIQCQCSDLVEIWVEKNKSVKDTIFYLIMLYSAMGTTIGYVGVFQQIIINTMESIELSSQKEQDIEILKRQNFQLKDMIIIFISAFNNPFDIAFKDLSKSEKKIIKKKIENFKSLIALYQNHFEEFIKMYQ